MEIRPWLTIQGRMLKHLAAMGVIEEVDTDTYASTPLTDTLRDPRHQAAFTVTYRSSLPPLCIAMLTM